MLRISFLTALLAAASATVLVRDDFSTNGNLMGSTPNVGGGEWTAHSGAGSGPITVSQGAITVSSALTEDLNSAFTAAVSAGTVYAGMDLNYATPSSFSMLRLLQLRSQQSLSGRQAVRGQH